MSKFEINRIIIELIRAILKFRFTSQLPKLTENNIWICSCPWFWLAGYLKNNG